MTAAAQIIPDRLEQFASISLSDGSHSSFEAGACAMEAAAWIAGEEWSDHPKCVSPVIATFMRSWNDGLPDGDRDRLLKDLVPLTIGTVAPDLEERRALMAADWLVRVHTPAWLRLAGLTAQADTVAALPEITSMAQVPSIRGPLEAVRKDATAAWDAARAAAWDAARAAAWDAAWDAARDATRAAARAAAWDAARAAAGAAAGAAARAAAGAAAGAAARAAARAAAWDAAWDAARDATRAAARAALAETKAELQLSAVDLVKRMCAAS